MRWAWLLLIGGAALADSGTTKVRVCDKTDVTKCASVDATGKLSIGGTISASSSVHSTAAAPTYVEGTDNAVSSDLGGATRVVCMGGTCGGASPFADASTFTAASTSVGVTAGVFNDSLTALASGKAGAPRMTSFRALHLNLRDNSGNEIPFPAALDADGGFKVHVQNAVAVTGTFWQATQPVSGTFWQATQPVSGTFWQATQPVSGTVAVSNAFALDATLTGGTAKAITRGGAKGVTTAADVTSTANGTDHQGLDVQVQNASLAVTGTFWQATQPVSGTFFQATQPVSGTVAATESGTWTVQPGNTANTTAWKVDGSAVTQPVSIAAGVTQGAGNTANPWAVQGTVASGVNIAGNPVPVGLKSIANASAPTNVTAGQEVYSSADVAGRQMVQTFHPNLIACNVAVSTATTLTAVGGSCAAPGAGLSIYITDITFSASAASGTAADSMPTIKSGTGGTCGTATAVVFEQFNPANGGFHASFQTPIRVGTITELCWIDSTAGSKAVHIQGFIAP